MSVTHTYAKSAAQECGQQTTGAGLIASHLIRVACMQVAARKSAGEWEQASRNRGTQLFSIPVKPSANNSAA